MKIVNYLYFDGTCEAAFAFYAKVLGGKLTALTHYGNSPAEKFVTPDFYGKVLHASLEVSTQTLLGSDAMPKMYNKPQGFTVALIIEDEFEAERIFNAFADGGQVRMPMQPTFWSACFGEVVDRFGIPWSVSGGSVPT